MDMNYIVPEVMFGADRYNSVKVKHQIDAIDEILRNEDERKKYCLRDGVYTSFSIPFISHSGKTTVTPYEFDVIRRFFMAQGWPVVRSSISGSGSDVNGIFLILKNP